MFAVFGSFKKTYLVAVTALSALAAPFISAEDLSIKTERYTLKVETLASGLSSPWSVALLPDGLTLITEKAGQLRVLRDGKLLARPVSGLPEVTVRGQGGLLDVVAVPGYPRNRLIYWSYSAGTATEVGTEVARGRLSCEGEDCRVSDVQVIFTQKPKANAGQHFGSRLVWDRSGNLFVTLGDRGRQDDAQNLGNHLGTVLRITETGEVPADNPFAKREGAMPEIFTYGNRNVQGASLHPRTGELWAHEHGPQGGDELNIIRAGRNYGWPTITYGVNYVTGTRIGEGTARDGLEQPLHVWTPSIGVSGMAFYTANAIPQWKGSLLLGGLSGQSLVRLVLDGERVVREERLLFGEVGRVRDVRVGPDGWVYLLSDAPDGALWRVQPR